MIIFIANLAVIVNNMGLQSIWTEILSRIGSRNGNLPLFGLTDFVRPNTRKTDILFICRQDMVLGMAQ